MNDQTTHGALLKEEAQCKDALRDLVAGPLPLVPVDDLLVEIKAQTRYEIGIRHARVFTVALPSRTSRRSAARLRKPEGPYRGRRLVRILTHSHGSARAPRPSIIKSSPAT